LAVKIVRQPKKNCPDWRAIKREGIFTGNREAPAALRAAGLVERLQGAGLK